MALTAGCLPEQPSEIMQQLRDPFRYSSRQQISVDFGLNGDFAWSGGARLAFVWYSNRTFGLGPLAVTGLPSPHGTELGGSARAPLGSKVGRSRARRAAAARI